MVRASIALVVLLAAGAASASAQVPETPPAPAAPSAAAPEAPPAPPAAPTPPPPPPPTGDAAQVISLLDNFCVPALKGKPIDKLARSLGLHKDYDDNLVLSLGGAKKITVSPPIPSNPTVCSLSVLYDIGGDGPIYTALNNWALAHANPYVEAKAHETSQVGDETHVTSTWSAVEADGAEGLVFIQARTADGKPLTGRADQATILFSIRPN
jgi:hypothetical protein